jgi:hypothetical protein
MNAESLNIETIVLKGGYGEKRLVDGAYHSGFAWAITNKHFDEVHAVYMYCKFMVDNGEYDFDDSQFVKIGKLIDLMVGNVDVFDPSSARKYYQIAFAMGVVDGVDTYEYIEEISAPRSVELRNLLEWEESETDCSSKVPGQAGSDSSNASLLDPAYQGSIQ